MTVVTIYSRPGCHLCEDAIRVVEAVRRDHAFALEIVDIETDDALLTRYLERIPVVAIDGEEHSEFFVDAATLAGRVATLGPPSAGPTQ